MKLSNWAKEQGIAYGTALKWFHAKTLPFPSEQLNTGTILVYPNKNIKEDFQKTFIYARVSSANKKSDLNSQAELCEQYCASKGWKVEKVYKEIASGTNDDRPKLNKILELDNARVVCLHKDRLTRFGFKYIERCVVSKNGSVEVVNPEKTDEADLLKDFIAIITSFCCRLYGARRGQAKGLKMKGVLDND
jgi:putative resolvase